MNKEGFIISPTKEWATPINSAREWDKDRPGQWDAQLQL